MTELHLTEEQIAMLAEGAIGGTERGLLEEHLRVCSGCFAAWQDAVRYRGIWETDPSIFRASALVSSIAHETPLRARPRPERRVAHAGAWWKTWGPAMAGGVAVLAVAAALAVWQPGVMRSNRSAYHKLFGPVRAAVEEASTGGSIVIPGAESVAATTLPAYRAGCATPSEAVSRALDDLARAYRDDETPPEVAHWLISGFLAVGQLDDAALYADDARRRYPGDDRFVILEAIIAYRANDMARAESLLKLALRRDPRNGAALLNLGLVQYEAGHFDLARRTFETVRTRFAGSPLGARATSLLDGLLGG